MFPILILIGQQQRAPTCVPMRQCLRGESAPWGIYSQASAKASIQRIRHNDAVTQLEREMVTNCVTNITGVFQNCQIPANTTQLCAFTSPFSIMCAQMGSGLKGSNSVALNALRNTYLREIFCTFYLSKTGQNLIYGRRKVFV